MSFGHTVDLKAIDNGSREIAKKDLKSWGAAIGNPSFLAASLRKRVNKIEKLLDNLSYLDEPHCALGILRSCLGAPKWHSPCDITLRPTNPPLFLQDFDNLQRLPFEKVRHRYKSTLGITLVYQ